MSKITDSVIRHKSFEVLLKKGLITKRKTYECLYKYKNDVSDPTSDSISANENTNDGSHDDCEMFECIRKTITHIRKTIWTHLNYNMKEQLVLLAGELGKLISSDVFEDGRLNISQQHKGIAILKEIEPFSWIKKRNPLLNSFLEGCTSVNINKETKKRK